MTQLGWQKWDGFTWYLTMTRWEWHMNVTVSDGIQQYKGGGVKNGSASHVIQQ